MITGYNKPDNWVILKINNENQTYYKLLCGWMGGYLYGNSWRMNSGIVSYKIEDDYIIFEGKSGSQYKCFKQLEMIRSNTHYVYQNLIREFGEDKVKRIDFVDFIKEFINNITNE